jgi:hypothetical protein
VAELNVSQRWCKINPSWQVYFPNINTDLMLSWLVIIDVDSILGALNHVDVGNTADVLVYILPLTSWLKAIG